MGLSANESIALVKELFRRNSSGGSEGNADLFTPDARYEGAYDEIYFDGPAAISAMHCGVVPQLFSPFVVSPVRIFPQPGGDVVIAECESEGTSVHTGKRYANKYVSFLSIRDGRFSLWREYYNPQLFMDAVGPDIGDIIGRTMPTDGIKTRA